MFELSRAEKAVKTANNMLVNNNRISNMVDEIGSEIKEMRGKYADTINGLIEFHKKQIGRDYGLLGENLGNYHAGAIERLEALKLQKPSYAW